MTRLALPIVLLAIWATPGVADTIIMHACDAGCSRNTPEPTPGSYSSNDILTCWSHNHSVSCAVFLGDGQDISVLSPSTICKAWLEPTYMAEQLDLLRRCAKDVGGLPASAECTITIHPLNQGGVDIKDCDFRDGDVRGTIRLGE